MKDFTIYENGDKASPLFLLLRSVKIENEDHLIEEIKNITDKPFNIAVFKAEDWNHDYSPWSAPGMDEASPFTGGGNETIKEILPIVEELKKTYSGEIIATGYSLAGLFALYMLYRTDVFSGAVCGSGSLWFNGFTDFAKENQIKSRSLVYLSLGGKEEKVNHPVVSTIGVKTKEMDSILSKDSNVIKNKFEMNSGGHFADSSRRLAKGIAWILENL